MKVSPGFRQVRAIFSLLAVLVLFLGVATTFSALRQRDLLEDISRAHTSRELELIGTLAREALIKRDYATVEQFLERWGTSNRDVIEIQAVAENGFVLAEYKSDVESDFPYETARDVYSAGRKLIVMKIRKDHTEVEKISREAMLRNISALLFFALVLAGTLWVTLRRTALVPMQVLVDEVNDLNRSLEERVRVRTADLETTNRELGVAMAERLKAEEGLLRSKEELETQNEELKKLDLMKDALIRDISHELKTPVAKHLMQLEIMSDILEKSGAFEPVKEVVVVMEEGIRRQQQAIRNILLISRLERGGRELSCEPFRFDKLMEEILNDYMHAVASYGFRLHLDLEPVMMNSDRERLWHVFSNIIDNAIKYRGREEPELGISLKEREGRVLVSVADNGVGLDAEEQERVFERFYQSSPSVEGVGLGLNIVRTIVKELQGTIQIESDGKDSGTVVKVTLPAKLETGESGPSPEGGKEA